MALGNTASLTSANLASINAQIAADAAYQRQFYDWCVRKFGEYNANLSTAAQQTAVGITAAGDQNQMDVFIADLNRIITLFTGGAPTTSNIVNDLSVVMGIS